MPSPRPKHMKKNMYKPTDVEIREVFYNSMWYEIVYTFGVPYHIPLDYCHWEFINYSRMVHARLLYDFLETKAEGRYQHDVLAVDFGYPPQKVILPCADRDRLNKDLVHFSYDRLRHTSESKKWPD